MICLGPGREGREITSGRRDARGLTFSAVIPARVLQPEVSTRGNQNGPIALCGYEMTLAPRHHIQMLEGEGRVGSQASPQLQRTPLSAGCGPLECLFPSLQKPSKRNDPQASPSPLPSRWVCPWRSSCWALAQEPIPLHRKSQVPGDPSRHLPDPVADCAVDLERHLTANRQTLLHGAPCLLPPGALGRFWSIDAGQCIPAMSMGWAPRSTSR